jgi:hypothetical protein
MKELKKKTLITSIVTIILVIFLSIGVLWAWFYDEEVDGTIPRQTGDLYAKFELYSGRDHNLDARLDPINLSYLGVSNITRTTRLSQFYNKTNDYLTAGADDSLNSWLSLKEGRAVSYKMLATVLKDSPSGVFELNFSNLAHYFYLNPQNYLDIVSYPNTLSPLANYLKTLGTTNKGNFSTLITTTAFQDYLGNNVARLMYKLIIDGVRIYSDENGTQFTAFNTGFEKILTTSVATESTNLGVPQLTIPKTEYYLHELSHSEPFVQDIVLSSEQLIEVDFHLVAIGETEAIDKYTNYLATEKTSLASRASSYINNIGNFYAVLNATQVNALSTIANNFIDDMSNVEISYLLGEIVDERKLLFNIDRITGSIRSIVDGV